MTHCRLTFLLSRLKFLILQYAKVKKIEGIKIGNEEIKLNVFTDDLTTFIKNNIFFFNRLLIILDMFLGCN